MKVVVVLDLDDTLFPEHQFVYSGFQAVSDWLQNRYTTHDFCQTAWQLFLEGVRGNIFNLALERLGIEGQPSLIPDLVKIYREHKPKIAPYNDALWLLEYLTPNYQLGMITDGYLITQKNKVESLGISSFFKAIIYSDLYGRENWKPSQVPYLKLMELMDSPESQYIYIGDNPTKDFVTAKQLKWLTVQICRERGEYANRIMEDSYNAHFKISSLLEFKDILANLDHN